MAARPLVHHPAAYRQSAFTALNWPMAFDAAMGEPARREIIDHIATYWPHRPMENVISISRIDMQATDAARRGADARSANPYPDHSPAGQLWLKCFAAELQRMAQATQAQAASVYTDD